MSLSSSLWKSKKKKKKNLLEVTRRHESPIKFLVLRERAFTQRRRNVIIHNTEPEVTQN